MNIASFRSKPLERYFAQGQSKGLNAQVVQRLGRMLALINDAARFDDLQIAPNYGLHRLTGDKDGRWAMTVTRNWRLTFQLIDAETIADVDLEDYH